MKPDRVHRMFKLPAVACLIFVVVVTLCCCREAGAQSPSVEGYAVKPVPTRYGMAITGGNSYTPENDISFVQLTGFALFDYEKVWGHKAPESLRYKLEGSIGTTTRPYKKLITSANMFAQYYLKRLSTKGFLPYIEGGIGIIYTDFQVEGQGLRVNFNPQAGLGAEFEIDRETVLFTALRLHHVSNGGLNHDNKGINSVILLFGRFF